MLKDALTVGAIITVRVKKAFEPKDGDYGPTQFTFLTFNGKDYRHYFKEKDFDMVTEGAVLQGLVESYKGSPYVKWSKTVQSDMPSAEEIQYIMSNSPNNPDNERMDTRDTSPPMPERKDDVQERIIKGMCFNNACTLLNGRDGGLNADTVQELTKELHDKMYEWLTN